jgi:hypothetical protein
MFSTTQCPKCGKILWFSSKLAGTNSVCPACGGVMKLEPAPAENPPPAAPENPPPQNPSPQNPTQANNSTESTSAAPAPADAPPPVAPAQADLDEKLPAAANLSLLAHQAAAAVGEVHVDMEETDLVQWTQPSAPQPPPTQLPVWSPPPLSGIPASGPPPADGEPMISWFPPPASRQSALTPPKSRAGFEPSQWKIPILATAGILAALVLLIGLLVYLPRERSTSNWEDAHRDEILTLKQDAEDLAIAGKYSDAYEKYQELERLVAGQTIQDPHLRDELAKAWGHRDELYEREMNGAPGAEAQSRPSEPSTEESAPIPAIAPATEPSSSLESPSGESPPAAAPILPPHPPVQPETVEISGLTDEQIGAAIEKGTDFLLGKFASGQLPPDLDTEHHDGLDSLAVYALMQSELATGDKRLDIHGEFMRTAIDTMKRLPMSDKYQTYGRAIRATALALYNRPEDQSALRDDAQWLLHAQYGGAYTYTDEFPRGEGFYWDNSNSQYGLLGVWSAAEAGVTVPVDFWQEVQDHWTRDQMSDGQWRYRNDEPDPRRSMTLAGVASLFVTQDYLDTQQWGDQVGRPPFSPALARGLGWLEQGDNSYVDPAGPEGEWPYYTLYGLERVGLASGFKYFGSHDWYRQIAAALVTAQQKDGSWGSQDSAMSVVDTSYALLFLARGRHPLTMNKLRFTGDWANRPRDLANLTKFASEELERPLNWQVVPLDHNWTDWTDSPILYLASDRDPGLTDEDRAKILQFIQNGGMLLTQSDGGSDEFTKFAHDLGSRLFPQYSWTNLPADHPIWNVSYRIIDPPPTEVITNGSRILMMHWPKDVTHFWQLREDKTFPMTFQLGVNVILYAAGKSDLLNRLQSQEIPVASKPAAASIRVARLKYDGNWDPEPAAWPRAQRWFRQQTGLDISLETEGFEDLPASDPPLAHLTGTAAVKFTDAQVDAVRKYVQGGGVLLIDPCGTPGDFLQSVSDLLLRAFPNDSPQTIAASSPLLTASSDGMRDISAIHLREFVRTLPQGTQTRPWILKSGRGHVILLPLDLTSGLLGTMAWGIAGYDPAYALAFLQNVVLWTWDGAKDRS